MIGPRSAWRARRYLRRWRDAMCLAELELIHFHADGSLRGRATIPTIRTVVSTVTGDHVHVRLLPGQRAEDFERVAAELAHIFGASACEVRDDHQAGYLWLVFT
jgi:S-DNA-T family DNA segregation ATPase FtsK/SpoIIIE